MSAANGWPKMVNDTQKMMFPSNLPCGDRIRSSGAVSWISGSCRNIPKNATPIRLCVGTPTKSSCRMAERRNTVALAVRCDHPRDRIGE